MVDVPDVVLDTMADAMLDPVLHDRSSAPLSSGNVVRKQVLLRALAAAEGMGWRLIEKE